MVTETLPESSSTLRAKCFLIGYLNLVACLVDTVLHVLITGIVSNGFQCDVDVNNLRAISWPWLERFLVIINVGTHGFYSVPLIMKNSVKYTPLPRELQCYPGMVHMYFIDVLNHLMNIIWLRFIIFYIYALHKKDLEPIRMFFCLSVVKFALQILYFLYRPLHITSISPRSHWYLCIIDLCLGLYFLLTISNYIYVLKKEKSSENIVAPPPYIECLMNMKKQRDAVNLPPDVTTEETNQDVLVNIKNELTETDIKINTKKDIEISKHS